VARAPQDPVSHLVLARFLVQRGDAAQGEAVLRAGIEALPRSEPIQLQLADLLERRGAMIEALEVYERLYGLNPESILVSNNYASLLAEFHEQDAEAVAKAMRIARRLRGSRVPHFQDTYAWITFLSGNSEEALRLLTEAAEALPGNPLVRYHFGRVLAAVGDAGRARSELEAALAIDPSFPKSQSAREILATLRPSNG
jgi:tetratricopeptide (TPR) repeat protein